MTTTIVSCFVRVLVGEKQTEKSFLDIILSFLFTFVLALPKRFVIPPAVVGNNQQSDQHSSSLQLPNSSATNELPSSHDVVLCRKALARIHEQEQNSPSSSYRTWAKLTGQDIVEATLEIPRRDILLEQWGITADEQRHLRLAEKETVTVHVAFPICLLPADVAAPKTVLDSGALELLDGEGAGGGLECLLSRILATHAASPVILYAHGGGYTVGTPQASELLSEMLLHHASTKVVPKPFVYASIKYRIAPEHPFPNAPLDATSVVAWFLERSNPKSVRLVGVSAGGGLMLSAYAGLLKSSLPHRPASVIAVCPMLDPSCDTTSFSENETSSLVAPAPWLRWSFRSYLQMPLRVAGELEEEDGESSSSLLLNHRAAWQESVWYRSSLRQLIEPEDLLNRLHCSDSVQIVITTNSADPLRDGGVAFAAATRGVTHLRHKGSHYLGSILDKKSRDELREALCATMINST
jgi:acetyl esterase/lipase